MRGDMRMKITGYTERGAYREKARQKFAAKVSSKEVLIHSAGQRNFPEGAGRN
jgi:hypothetical protein